jgi:hypothetical protein
MPAGIFLIWPALHLFYGIKEVHSHKVATPRRLAGSFVFIISLLLMGQPYGWEQGLFFWLFALMALGLGFVQLRIFQTTLVQLSSVISLIFLALACVELTGSRL